MHIKEEMPEFPLLAEWFNGEVSKRDLIGDKPSIIHFWSISCHLCKLEMESLKELHHSLHDKVNIVGVHLPRSENDLDRKKVQECIENYQLKQPILLDHELILADDYENEYVPAYYLFDKRGALRHFQAGARGMGLLTKRLTRILELK